MVLPVKSSLPVPCSGNKTKNVNGKNEAMVFFERDKVETKIKMATIWY